MSTVRKTIFTAEYCFLTLRKDGGIVVDVIDIHDDFQERVVLRIKEIGHGRDLVALLASLDYNNMYGLLLSIELFFNLFKIKTHIIR